MPTTPTPVDRPAEGLRDRIRRAICEASGFTWLPNELMEPDEYGEHADAVLSVLPAPALAVAQQLLGTTTVLLSGPGGEPYWVELDPERTAALRDALARPDDQQPAPADRAAEGLHATVWVDGDPLMETTASAVWEQCRTENSVVVDDPRNIAAVAATVARQLLGTPTTNTETETEAPVDRAAILNEAADEIAGIDFHPNARARSLDIATGLARRLRALAAEAAAGVQPAASLADAVVHFEGGGRYVQQFFGHEVAAQLRELAAGEQNR